LENNKYLLSFHVSIELIKGFNNLFELDFEGISLDCAIDESFEILSCACNLIDKNGEESQKEAIFKILIKNSKDSFYSYDYNYNFISLAIKFIGENNKEEIFEAIDRIGSGDYYHSKNSVLKFRVIESLEKKKSCK
jgi:hypothetical protein